MTTDKPTTTKVREITDLVNYKPIRVTDIPRNCPVCSLELSQIEEGLAFCPDCDSDVTNY